MSNAAPELKTGMRSAGANLSNPEKHQTFIRISPSCKLLPHLSVNAFRDIQGVHDVHVDTALKTIRIIFDGMQETKARLAAYLCSCERKPRCGADQPCDQHSEKFNKAEPGR
jgi:hypothetical protein